MIRTVRHVFVSLLFVALLCGGALAQLAVIAEPSFALATPTVVVSSDDLASVSGQPVTFTATVTGIGVTPDGTVTFLDGVTPVCSAVVLGSVTTNIATATCPTSAQHRAPPVHPVPDPVHPLVAAQHAANFEVAGRSTTPRVERPASRVLTGSPTLHRSREGVRMSDRDAADVNRAPLCPFCGVTTLPAEAAHVIETTFTCENPDCEAFGDRI